MWVWVRLHEEETSLNTFVMLQEPVQYVSASHAECKRLLFTFAAYLHTKISRTADKTACGTVITSHVKHTLQGRSASPEQEVHTNCTNCADLCLWQTSLSRPYERYPATVSPHVCVVQLHRTALAAVDSSSPPPPFASPCTQWPGELLQVPALYETACLHFLIHSCSVEAFCQRPASAPHTTDSMLFFVFFFLLFLSSQLYSRRLGAALD